MTKVTVIIKALNEEKNIARAIESSLEAVAPYQGEVILADSASSDRTVEIAKQYPVTIVVLENPAERCCGVGPQLGFQHSHGEYVYILDGDMVLNKEFIEEAISLLDQDPTLAGVGGFVDEMNVSNLEFRGRMQRLHKQRSHEPKETACLAGGGLYRRKSIDAVGYMSDRNLHALEEYDLAARLISNGWRLVSLPTVSSEHYSYSIGTLNLLWHRWKNGAFLKQGEILRSSLARGYWPDPIKRIRAVRYSIAIYIWWIFAITICLLFPDWLARFAVLLAGPLAIWAAVAFRHKSVIYGLYALVVWHLNALGMLFGFMRRRKSPTEPIKSQIIQTADTGVGVAPTP
jgi:GT2 family glycosyltransferase